MPKIPCGMSTLDLASLSEILVFQFSFKFGHMARSQVFQEPSSVFLFLSLNTPYGLGARTPSSQNPLPMLYPPNITHPSSSSGLMSDFWRISHCSTSTKIDNAESCLTSSRIPRKVKKVNHRFHL
eukprot:TRINITY_DN23241_c0_g1_i1.p1 TRINITY_DN23241_c0_g1~~TRINITY_DN23241_c0_g1_i1.p1  ORF type:complete len:125 (-),score=7.14 TRINITY_DN23241_c0_g1_i1:108-482(-)